MVSSSTGDIESLIKKFEKLKEVVSYIKQNIQANDDRSEIDDILSNIGDFNVVTKDEAGSKFYNELAQNIYAVSKELLVRYCGMVSLVDVFWVLNEKRKISLISASDMLLSCQRFQQLNLPIRLVELHDDRNRGNIKVIQYANFNSEEDFKNNVAKHIDKGNGITAEQLARKSRIPLLVAYSKLNMALQTGKIILDDSLEGKKYYFNDILYPDLA